MRLARMVAVCSLLVLTLWPVPASAVDKVVVRGDCVAGPSTWKLVTRQFDASTLLIRVEINGGVAGQEWSMFVTDNGDKVIRNAKTSGTGGFVRWVRKTNDRAGADDIVMSALNRDSGETCGGSLSFQQN